MDWLVDWHASKSVLEIAEAMVFEPKAMVWWSVISSQIRFLLKQGLGFRHGLGHRQRLGLSNYTEKKEKKKHSNLASLGGTETQEQKGGGNETQDGSDKEMRKQIAKMFLLL